MRKLPVQRRQYKGRLKTKWLWSKITKSEQKKSIKTIMHLDGNNRMSSNKLPSHVQDFTSAAKKLNAGRKCSKEPKLHNLIRKSPWRLASYDLRFFSFQKNPYIEFNVTNLKVSFLIGSNWYDSISQPLSMAAVRHCSLFFYHVSKQLSCRATAIKRRNSGIHD